MDPRTALKLVDRIQELERGQVRVRLGVVTDDSPLSVALGGSDVPFTDVKAVDGQVLAADDVVVVLTWGRDLLVLGTLNDGAASNTTVNALTVLGGIVALGGQVSYLSYANFPETSDPVGVANQAFVYARDNGSGKTQLCVQFPTGSPIVIATEA